MEKKILQHDRFQVCGLSKKKIDTTKDNYTLIMDCQGENIVSYKFYKTELFVDLVKGKGKMIEENVMERSQKKAFAILDRMGITKPQYQIK